MSANIFIYSYRCRSTYSSVSSPQDDSFKLDGALRNVADSCEWMNAHHMIKLTKTRWKPKRQSTHGAETLSKLDSWHLAGSKRCSRPSTNAKSMSIRIAINTCLLLYYIIYVHICEEYYLCALAKLRKLLALITFSIYWLYRGSSGICNKLPKKIASNAAIFAKPHEWLRWSSAPISSSILFISTIITISWRPQRGGLTEMTWLTAV